MQPTTKLPITLKELVALNLENTLSRPETPLNANMMSNYMYQYCKEIEAGPMADCMLQFATLACYDNEHCIPSSNNYGGPEESVEGYAKDILHIMVQIQYLDR